MTTFTYTISSFQGEDLLERSSELIFSGDINKINSAGWSQERYFFLFDHQLIYCKKVRKYSTFKNVICKGDNLLRSSKEKHCILFSIFRGCKV